MKEEVTSGSAIKLHEFNGLEEKSGDLGAPRQQVLSHVGKQAEVDDVEMGAHENRIPFLTENDPVRMHGTDRKALNRSSAGRNDERLKPHGRQISQLPEQGGYNKEIQSPKSEMILLKKKQVEQKQTKKLDLEIPFIDRPTKLFLIIIAVFATGFITGFGILGIVHDKFGQDLDLTVTAKQLSFAYADDIKKADGMFSNKRFFIMGKVTKVDFHERRDIVIPINYRWEWRWRKPTVIVEVEGILPPSNPWLKGFTEYEGWSIQPGEMILASCVGDGARGAMPINEQCRLLQYNLPASPRTGGSKAASRIPYQ
jgi:hypothetical protein